ncbi:PREDICTED: uncharacterized protein LOC104720952 isoform X2 [Camelina sativa]|uniref:Uncharacterized protein LOC104720952 isoform X1 n=1 Tax=Camelina sativa TaxID=90675 RepID=A0ABM0U7K7_CAMSA|nr:PREDICTED: uncharacterized protein LOC104720952 isoform X1 [Camelina sativa]XP_010437152.1 PREDICTED: uncharacterized protein LOC104720952 isoform X2 [Camelina sativa]
MMKRPIPSSWPWWILRGGRKDKEPEALKFPPPPPSTKMITRAANINNNKRKDLQEVESFGSSGSESVALAGDGPEWSVGWTEPHGPDFQSDDEADDGGFLVLVPCYRALVEASSNTNNQLLSAVKNLPSGLPPDGKNYMEQWLSSLQNL